MVTRIQESCPPLKPPRSILHYSGLLERSDGPASGADIARPHELHCTAEHLRWPIKREGTEYVCLRTRIRLWELMEPVLGFEPRTDGLQNRCSTTELNWLNDFAYWAFSEANNVHIWRDDAAF